ncbi:unnamed protein product [Rotaria sp. Silwood2]|nr:unnamed protein product [Rotaria sp. Silwood2]
MAMQYNTDQKGLRIDHTTLTPRYSITNNESLNEGIAYLNKHGYAIFRDVLSQDEINTNKDLLSRFFETIPRCNIRRNDPSTWSSFWEVQKNKIHSMIILFLCLRPVVFDIGTLIPNTAQQLSVTVFIRSGYDSNSPYNVWLWTEFGNNQKDIKFKRGYRYPQSAISFDSETFNFAYSSNHPKLYLMSDVTAETGNMFLELFAVGYAQ